MSDFNIMKRANKIINKSKINTVSKSFYFFKIALLTTTELKIKQK